MGRTSGEYLKEHKYTRYTITLLVMEADRQKSRDAVKDVTEHSINNDAEAQAALVVATDPVTEFDVQSICNNFSMVLYGARRKGEYV